MNKTYSIRVHYDVATEVEVEATDANEAVIKAVKIAGEISLTDMEITDVEAFIEKIG